MTEVYVVGTDMIKFGRFPDRTVPELGAQAALMALDDCGLTIHDMQALYCGNLGEAGRWSASACCARSARPAFRWSTPPTPAPPARPPSAKAGWRSRPASTTWCWRRRRADGQGPPGRRGRRQRHPDRGPARLRHHAVACSPMSAWSTRANTARPSSSSPRCR